jgi:hypothetical protein
MSVAETYLLPCDHVADKYTGHLARLFKSNAICWVDMEVTTPVYASLNEINYFAEAITWDAVIISDMHAVVDRSGAMGNEIETNFHSYSCGRLFWWKVLFRVLINKDCGFFKSRCWVMGHDCLSALLPRGRLGEHLPITPPFDFLNRIPPFRQFH